jgi:hypothetical protein
MRLRSLFFASALAWRLTSCAVAYAGEPATVDPFLKAAQMAEEIPAAKGVEEPDLAVNFEANGEPVACGDEVDMAGLIEPDPRRQGRWSALTELTVLFPSYSTSTLATASDEPILGPRISLGWESAAGFGIRGRGWGFDSPVEVDQTFAPFGYYSPLQMQYVHEIEFSGSRFDLDFYKRLQYQRGELAFGASLTAAHLKLEAGDQQIPPSMYDFDAGLVYSRLPLVPGQYNRPLYLLSPAAYQSGSVVRNRAGGLGLLVEGSHRFYETPIHAWSVFGRGRVAYLIGDWEAPYSNGLQKGDANMAIGEAALGLEYRRKFNLADALVQCSFEVQSWDVSIVDRINFAGVTTGIGLAW